MSKKPVTVIHVVPNLNIGGMERVVINIVMHLDRRRFIPIVCCLEEKGELGSELEGKVKTVEFRRRLNGFDLLLPWRLARVFRQERVGIVHAHNLLSRNYSMIAARISGAPILINTKHGVVYSNSNKIFWNKFANVLVDKYVAVSRDVRNSLIQNGKVRKENITIIINGIDFEKYAHSDGNAIGDIRSLLDGYYVIGTVGRLDPAKNHYCLILAFADILHTIDNVKLVIIGGGPLREDLENLCKQLKIQDKVLFLGARNDVPNLLSILNLFVLSSITEGTSLTLLEAMAAGIPVVATNVGGNPEVVQSGKTGLIVPSDDPEKLSNAIRYNILNRDISEQMGIN